MTLNFVVKRTPQAVDLLDLRVVTLLIICRMSGFLWLSIVPELKRVPSRC